MQTAAPMTATALGEIAIDIAQLSPTELYHLNRVIAWTQQEPLPRTRSRKAIVGSILQRLLTLPEHEQLAKLVRGAREFGVPANWLKKGQARLETDRLFVAAMNRCGFNLRLMDVVREGGAR